MQTYEDNEPIVRIRDYKQDRVNFMLENVDLAYAQQLHVMNIAEQIRRFANSFRRVVQADIPTVGRYPKIRNTVSWLISPSRRYGRGRSKYNSATR
jgi:hypothetical protein